MAAITPAGRPFSLQAICEGEREKGRERERQLFLEGKRSKQKKFHFKKERGEKEGWKLHPAQRELITNIPADICLKAAFFTPHLIK